MIATAKLLADIRGLASPLRTVDDVDPILERSRNRKFVAIGDASHGTHEYYDWRARLSRRLIQEQGFTWIGVEGDWPNCWRIDRWVRGVAEQHLDARGLLAGFDRWPTWMWANEEVADFLDWLHGWNLDLPVESRVAFVGLDVYSLWDSLERVMAWLTEHAPDAAPVALRAWQCFAPYQKDPHRYARSTRLDSRTCEVDVANLLVEVRRLALGNGDDAFDAEQNAVVAVEAERYYRAMVRTDRGSWNIRDTHMMDTIDRVATHLGSTSKGLIWEHNTHIGDARGTTMTQEGLVNVGQLLRERYGETNVLLVGTAGYQGHVIGSKQWGAADERMPVPPARADSHEALLHEALAAPAILDFGLDPTCRWLSARRGHRAIGVVYNPRREAGNYVPTVMGRRYDAIIWFENTSALHPLHSEGIPDEAEYETEPSGF